MKIKAPAKLNLYLNITGKREDGYHLLESLFVPLQLGDEITLEPANDIEVITPGISLVNNTALKAAELVRDFYSIKEGARITIEKNIPIAAGLGGSATNAGTLINALCELWDIDASFTDLQEIALKIGADVPYFLMPQLANVSGIGEVIKPTELNLDMHILVIYPGFELLAKDVYKSLRYSKKSSAIIAHDNMKALIYEGGNDLEFPAISLCPEIGELLREIKAQDGCKLSRMSGSGSACFGIFETEYAALKAEEYFAKLYFTHYEYLA